MIHHAPRTTSLDTIEESLQQWASEDHGTAYVAVEVFDHPDAAYSHEHQTTTGPIVYGPSEEVYAWLAEHDHQTYDEQACAYIEDPDEEEALDQQRATADAEDIDQDAREYAAWLASRGLSPDDPDAPEVYRNYIEDHGGDPDA